MTNKKLLHPKRILTLALAGTLALGGGYLPGQMKTVMEVQAEEVNNVNNYMYMTYAEISAQIDWDTINETNAKIRELCEEEQYEEAAKIWYEACKDTDLCDIVETYGTNSISCFDEMKETLTEEQLSFYAALKQRKQDYDNLRLIPGYAEKHTTYWTKEVLYVYASLDDDVKAMIPAEFWESLKEDFTDMFTAMFSTDSKYYYDESGELIGYGYNEMGELVRPAYDKILSVLIAYVQAPEVLRDSVSDELLNAVVNVAETYYDWDYIIDEIKNWPETHGENWNINFDFDETLFIRTTEDTTDPEDPDNPDIPSNPENPDDPSDPENPANPENPEIPEIPEDPKPPVEPEQGYTVDKPLEQSVKTVNVDYRTMAQGKKITLNAEDVLKNGEEVIKWTTSNKSVATVNSNGVVTAKKNAGGKSVKITASIKGKKVVYKIKVVKGVVKKVSIKGKNTIKVGKKVKLKVKVKATKGAYKAVTWTSSNKKYAIVSSKGIVKATKAGRGKTVKITATALDGSNKKAVKKIKIK